MCRTGPRRVIYDYPADRPLKPDKSRLNAAP
jgi:hypothetical protein